MKSIKETYFYNEVIKELIYPFGNIFIFQGFVVSEINRGVIFNWEDHGKIITEDIACFLGTNGGDLIYISNRIHPYSVFVTDWFKFFNNSYSLKSYFIVSQNAIGIVNSLIENLFFSTKIKRFRNIEMAVNYIKTGLVEIA
ncbi:MAG TPA: hypothetical protein PKD13_04120 [Mariniflexile sp.]|nr:hypothetical protein [Mariniflexile sp.]